LAIHHELSEGAWKDISTQGYDNPARGLPPEPFGVPQDVGWKRQAVWSIAMLRDALGIGPEALAALDIEWDATERKLYHLISGAAEDRDPEIRGAAERLRPALLSGGGTAQTRLSYDEEVDFGRRQARPRARGASCHHAAAAPAHRAGPMRRRIQQPGAGRGARGRLSPPARARRAPLRTPSPRTPSPLLRGILPASA
jgi:hypothetical protein